MTQHRVLLLPGWQNSGAGHWQSHWEGRFGYTRVAQDDWLWPKRGDWLARLDQIIQEGDGVPAVLVAHSLGCHLVAAWAARSAHVCRVLGALLVAPPDTERDDTPPQLYSWRPMVRGRLPFAAIAVASSNDPYCAFERAVDLADGWGASLAVAGHRAHLNAQSGLDDWPEGHELLLTLASHSAAST